MTDPQMTVDECIRIAESTSECVLGRCPTPAKCDCLEMCCEAEDVDDPRD